MLSGLVVRKALQWPALLTRYRPSVSRPDSAWPAGQAHPGQPGLATETFLSFVDGATANGGMTTRRDDGCFSDLPEWDRVMPIDGTCHHACRL